MIELEDRGLIRPLSAERSVFQVTYMGTKWLAEHRVRLQIIATIPSQHGIGPFSKEFLVLPIHLQMVNWNSIEDDFRSELGPLLRNWSISLIAESQWGVSPIIRDGIQWEPDIGFGGIAQVSSNQLMIRVILLEFAEERLSIGVTIGFEELNPHFRVRELTSELMKKIESWVTDWNLGGSPN